MKPLRNLIQTGTLALMCIAAYACVDEAYDLSKADYSIEVLKEGVSLPIGNLEMSMDSILKDVDHSFLKVQDGVYTFYQKGSMNTLDLTGSMTNFSLTKPGDGDTIINLYKAPTVPLNVPTSVNEIYSGTTTISLPNFTTSLIDVKRIQLKNTTFTMTASTSSNLGGSDLANSIVITCTPSSMAEFYDNTGKITSWTLKANETKTIEIRSVDLSSAKNISITYTARFHPTSNNAVTISAPSAQTTLRLSNSFNGIDFESVYGKITYSRNDTKTESFKGFGDLLANNNVLSFHDPRFKLKWTSNLGVPILFSFNMSSKNTLSLENASLTNTSFTMQPVSAPNQTRTDSFTIGRSNGTSGLFKINPDQITTGYTLATDQSSSNYFIAKNTQLALESSLEIPVQFDSDLTLNVGDTIDNPFLDITKKMTDQDSLNFGFLFDVENRIPLNMEIKLSALNANLGTLYTISSGTIRAAKVPSNSTTGFATDTTLTTSTLQFSKAQINQLKDVSKFKVEFIVKATNAGASFVSIQPSDYIKIKVGARVAGGVLFDLKKKEEQ
jgi:hypothetical protein